MIKNKLIEFRLQMGMTQEEFANFLGFSQSQVSKWEGQRQQPYIENLFIISEKLGVSIEELFWPPE